MTFPIRPRHIAGEPAGGYMLRLVEANGYAWRKSSFASRGISMSDLARGETSALVPILGRETVERIDLYTPRRTEDGRVMLCGQMLEPSQLYYERRCFCVGCWAEDNSAASDDRPWRCHLRSWWFVAPITTCPIHSLRLDDRCPTCERTTQLADGRVTFCPCGRDLTRSPGRYMEPTALVAERYVIGRLGGLAGQADPILDDLPLGDAISLMQRLGCCLAAGRDVRFGKVRPEMRPGMLLAGFQAIRTGNDGVEDEIERLLKGPGKPDRLWVQLGQLYSWFAALPSGPLQAWLAQRIANVVGRNQLRWQGWDRHTLSSPTPDRISASQAKACFGSGWGRTVALLDAAGMRCDVQERCRPTVDRRAVLALSERVDRLLDVGSLASVMGVTPGSVRSLAAAGVLPFDTLARRALRYPKFDPLRIDEILDTMAGKAPLVDVPPTGSISVAAASRNVGMVAICLALLDGRLSACARVRGRPGLRGIHVPSAGIAGILRSNDSPWISLEEGRRRLGMRRNGLTLVLASGHIATTRDARGRPLLLGLDVERFRDRYVATSELARSRGTSAKMLLSRLAAAGCHPAIVLSARGRIELRLFERGHAANLA